jgi:hypothetical protein
MGYLSPESELHTRSLHKLRDLCGRSGRLPAACYLQDDIELEDDFPISQGGFSDVYRGIQDGHPVALKVLRVHASDRAKVEKVCTISVEKMDI